MAKFRKNKFFKKRYSQNNPKQTKKFEPETSETITVKKSDSVYEPTTTKSWIKSGTKYIYIIAAAALLSGIFTPLTIGVEIQLVITGMCSIFLGLGGSVVIILGIKNQKFTTIMVCGGLGMMIVSLILIYEVAERSLFG